MYDLVEVILTQFDGRKVRFQTRYLRGGPDFPMLQEEATPGELERSLDEWQSWRRTPLTGSTPVQRKVLIPDEKWTTIQRVMLHITDSAAPLRRMPWETVFKGKKIYRFTPSPERPRPRRLERPKRIVLACDGQTTPSDSTGELRIHRCALDEKALLATLQPRAEHSPGDALLVLAGFAHRQEDELTLALTCPPEALNKKPPWYNNKPLPELLASLRGGHDAPPQAVVLLLRKQQSQRTAYSDSLDGTVYAAAHELVAAGVPLVVALTGVDVLPEPIDKETRAESIQATVAELQQALVTASNAVDLAWNIFGRVRDGNPYPHPPVIVTSYRFGNLWHPGTDEQARETLDKFRNGTRRTVVVGPMLGGEQRQWLRAPLDIIGRHVRLPMYDEHLKNGHYAGSYIQASLKDRTKIEILYFLCWSQELERIIRECSGLQTYIKDDQHIANKEARGAIALCPTDPAAAATQLLQQIVRLLPGSGGTSLSQEQLDTLRDESFDRLNHLVALFCPSTDHQDARSQVARALLETTPWWSIAALKANLYISTDPIPLLEYALALQDKSGVAYTVFPWHTDTNVFLWSAASTQDRARPIRRVVYLCGSIADPPVLLLSEEELVEQLLLGRESWLIVLREIGEFMGRDSHTLFLGFSPEEAIFRQILRTLFLDGVAPARSQLIIAPRPDEGFFSDPDAGADFLKNRMEYSLSNTKRRALGFQSMGGSPPAQDDADIKLVWTRPELAVEALLKRES